MAGEIQLNSTSFATESSGLITVKNSKLDTDAVFPTFVGMIASFAMSSAPTGWLVCNGAEYAIASYGDLYTAIGTTWGTLTNGSGGAGSTHFRVPDLRGEFLRGFDNGTGNDPDTSSRAGGDAVGSSQTDGFQNHTHVMASGSQAASISGESNSVLATSASGGGDHTVTGNAALTSGAWTGSVTGTFQTNIRSTYGTPSISSETRPRNKNVQYCIKY